MLHVMRGAVFESRYNYLQLRDSARIYLRTSACMKYDIARDSLATLKDTACKTNKWDGNKGLGSY